MKPFRRTDGYVEVSAFSIGDMIEIYVTVPGTEQVLRVHMPEKLGVSLALWLIQYFFFDRFAGLKTAIAKIKQKRAFFRGIKLEEAQL